MGSNFKAEVRSIQLALKGSHWATAQAVRVVLEEYERLIGVSRLRDTQRRVSLQILYSSRAIDSLLKHVVNEDASRSNRRVPAPSLGNYIDYIEGNGVYGRDFPPQLIISLRIDVKDKRNTYLHQAGMFPSDVELKRFLSVTLDGINEIAKIPRP
jgi:hypothetical protein